jgi:hypothetical protein
MKALCKLILVFSFFAWTSCEKDAGPVIDDSDLLLGYWSYRVVTDTVFRFERTGGLAKNVYGFQFKTGHYFVERKSSGFCGTPPVILYDYEGTWSRQDSLIDIEVPYWGGMEHYKWKIISLDRSSLTIALVQQEFQD